MSPKSAVAEEVPPFVPAERLRASARPRWGEIAIRGFIAACGLFVVVATAAVILFIARAGVRGIQDVGLGGLLSGEIWKPEANVFGGYPLIFGTAISALGAALVGAIPALLAAVWVSELAPKSARSIYRRTMEIAAAVPSVVYGWLALVHLVPQAEWVARALHGEDVQVSGEGLASSAVLLGIMIAPTVFLLSLDALSRVSGTLREASAALGASSWQTAFRICIPSAGRSLFTAVFFGFARAAGETMAVQMVIGGARRVPENLFSPATTISTQIVMDMQNATPNTTASNVLFSMSLVLLVLSAGVVLISRVIGRWGSKA
ncbi:phosphate ABC transporter permease subunit PstC [Pendulispora brunnea]|uniref:Phosphate transport system permease protein n=1 Tax=Pendulispora brunnea TaxID=2905690 RepID=A0ABZ2KDH7_9BACT